MNHINPKVLEIGKMNLRGNLVPEAWFQNITRPNGKAYITAIIILADIIYWYRPTEIRNEHTGKIIGYRQKFKADMLQKSYSELANKFGISKNEAINAVKHLEEIGVIKRVFRTIKSMPNTLFIDIFPQKIQEISIFNKNKFIENRKKIESGNDLYSRVRSRSGYRCERCGALENREIQFFHVHHVISRKDITHRYDENNLVLLCPFCHMWVHSKDNIFNEFLNRDIT